MLKVTDVRIFGRGKNYIVSNKTKNKYLVRQDDGTYEFKAVDEAYAKQFSRIKEIEGVLPLIKTDSLL